MITTEYATQTPQEIRRALSRSAWHAQGRHEAFRDVLENGKGPEEIAAEIQELEEWLVDPRRVHGSWALGTSVRRCAEGHWAGLKEILCILEGRELVNEPIYPTPPSLPNKE